MKAACLKCKYYFRMNKRNSIYRKIECIQGFCKDNFEIKNQNIVKNHDKLQKKGKPKTKILKTFEMNGRFTAPAANR